MKNEQDLIKICRLWYVTRQTIFGTPVTKEAGEALTAFDSMIQKVIEDNNIQ